MTHTSAPTLTGGQIFTGPVGWSQLESLWHQGQLPLTVAQTLTFGEAAGLVLLLPCIRGHRDGMPVGWGLLPPDGCPPLIRTALDLRDRFHEPIGRGAKGVVGAMWREPQNPDRVAVRLWFRAELGHGFRPEGTSEGFRGQWRLVDTFDNAIGSVLGLEGQIPQGSGWQIARLDNARPGGEP